MYRPHLLRRPAFTLIELLVVMSIIAILAAITVAILPSLSGRQNASNGAGTLQGALNSARERALRDQLPRGLRLLPDPNNAGVATSLQLIGQPDNFTGGMATVAASDPNKQTVTFQNADLTGGFSDPTLWPVRKGDYLEMQSWDYTISTVPSGTQLTVIGSITSPVPGGSTTDYRIIRAPRPMEAEQPITLPTNVAIDVNGAWTDSQNQTHPRSLVPTDQASGAWDIVFSPAGTVIRDAGNQGKVILWVRDLSMKDRNGNPGGDQTLVVVFTRTGMITSVAPDAGPNNDYTTYPVQNGQPTTPYSSLLTSQPSGL